MPHKRSHRKRSSSNLLNKGVEQVKTTSKKYMPKVKEGLEGVGAKVVKTSRKSVPFLKRMTRKLFSVFGIKSRRR